MRQRATCGINLLDGFWSAEPYYGFLNTFKYDEEKVILDKYQSSHRPESGRAGCEYFTPQTLEQELSDCELRVDLLVADVAGEPYSESNQEFAVVAMQK